MLCLPPHARWHHQGAGALGTSAKSSQFLDGLGLEASFTTPTLAIAVGGAGRDPSVRVLPCRKLGLPQLQALDAGTRRCSTGGIGHRSDHDLPQERAWGCCRRMRLKSTFWGSHKAHDADIVYLSNPAVLAPVRACLIPVAKLLKTSGFSLHPWPPRCPSRQTACMGFCSRRKLRYWSSGLDSFSTK